MKTALVLKALLAAILFQVALAQGEVPRSFLERDRDGNGRLSQEESGFPSELLQSLDESNNGELSLAEFHNHWRNIAPAPNLENEAYGTESPRQKLDLYLPSNPSGKVPLVLWIHGGSWKEGSKRNCPFQTLTQHGFAVASLDYRLIPEYQFPAQLEDGRLAIAFLKKEALRRGFEIGRVTSIGLSAGGHLSLLLGVEGSVDKVISFGAPVDLTNKLAQEHHRETLEALVGTPLEDHQDTLKAASPALQDSVASTQYLLFHGLGDRTVPYTEALLMSDTAARANAAFQVSLVPDGSHTLVGGPQAWSHILLFLKSD